MKYHTKSVEIEATQWFKNGDHPRDNSVPIKDDKGDDTPELTEGKIVRKFHSPNIPAGSACPKCGKRISNHGLMGTGIVCPGDWIITEANGKMYSDRPLAFGKFYEEVPVEGGDE